MRLFFIRVLIFLFALSCVSPAISGQAFEVYLESGKISAVREYPQAWGIFIDNPGNWQSRIQGNCEVGAAALDPGFFNRFLAVEKLHGPDDPDFSIEMRLYVTRDFDETRTIVIREPDLSLMPG